MADRTITVAAAQMAILQGAKLEADAAAATLGLVMRVILAGHDITAGEVQNFDSAAHTITLRVPDDAGEAAP